MKSLIFFLILFSFSLEVEQKNTVYEVEEFFNKIAQEEITEEDSTKLINSLKQILERYVYLDILKKPPQPSEGYHNVVDLIKELDKIQKGKRSLYDFYRDIKMLINKCQDLHLDFTNSRLFNGLSLNQAYFIFPLIFGIIENKMISVVSQSLSNYFEEDLINQLKAYERKEILSINGENPNDFIQNYNGDFRKLKSPQAQYSINQDLIPMIQLNNFPFTKEKKANLEIVFYDETKITVNYKILYIENESKLSEFFEIPPTVDGIHTISHNIQFLRPKETFSSALNKDKLKKTIWDFEYDDGKLKCQVDKEKEVNVIYQNSFLVSDLNKGKKFLENCFESFDKNNYPIVVIQSKNGGGYIDLADHFIGFINLNKTIPLYLSMRNSDEVKIIGEGHAFKKPGECDYILGEELFKNNIEDFYGKNENGDDIYHKRTQIFDLSSDDRAYFYNFRKKAKNIRKPTEILIFTDGFSYSATSIFIKETQIKGGAIIVGYSGNPEIQYKFDSSQSPSPVLNTDNMEDNLSKKIKDLGFSLSYPFGEMLDRLDQENEINIPLEYKINPIDLRAKLYNGYSDGSYDEFIAEAKYIFKVAEESCNPNNKKLLMVTETCKFTDVHMHGGYECSENGTWSDKCVPSYCDTGYYFDEIKVECIKDICVKENKKNKIYFIFSVIFISLLGFFLGMFIVFTIVGGYKKKNYLLVPIVLFLILFAVFLILYLTK